MKTFFILSIIFAFGSASLVQFSPSLYTAAIPITTSYHAQDSLGQYSYGYSGGSSAKTEYKSLDGVTRGSYTYVDSDGKLQTVEYTADSLNGFQASGTNLPKAPIDDKTAPKPVEDTPEVAKAKAEHLNAVKEAELRAAEQPDENEGGEESTDEAKSSQEAETESPNRMESSSEPSESANGSAQQASSENTNGNGSENGNGNAEITRLSSNGLTSIGSGLSNLNGLSLGPLSTSGQLSVSDLNALASLQLNGDISSDLRSIDAIRLSEITPATTSQLLSLPLSSLPLPSLRLPSKSYSILSPSILTAIPTLGATSSQTISRTLPISLSSSFLTKRL